MNKFIVPVFALALVFSAPAFADDPILQKMMPLNQAGAPAQGNWAASQSGSMPPPAGMAQAGASPGAMQKMPSMLPPGMQNMPGMTGTLNKAIPPVQVSTQKKTPAPIL